MIEENLERRDVVSIEFVQVVQHTATVELNLSDEFLETSLQVRSMKITLHFAFYKINAIKEKKETERKREENIRLQEWKGNDPR